MTYGLSALVSRRDFLTITALLPGALAGCIGANRPPAPRHFYLMPLTAVSGDLPQVTWSLAVDPPETVPDLGDLPRCAELWRLTGVSRDRQTSPKRRR